jgi:hypothetical protein
MFGLLLSLTTLSEARETSKFLVSKFSRFHYARLFFLRLLLHIATMPVCHVAFSWFLVRLDILRLERDSSSLYVCLT